jgi:hypothetical protein
VAGKFTEPTLHQIGENGWRMVETKRLLKTTSSAIHEHSSSMRAQLLSNNVCPKRLSLPLLMTQAGQNVQSAATAESVASTQSEENLVFSKDVTAKIVAIVGSNTLSPLSATPWEEVMQHMVSLLPLAMEPTCTTFMCMITMNLIDFHMKSSSMLLTFQAYLCVCEIHRRNDSHG